MPAELLKVLFVDDEPLVLQGLQRMLRGMRSEWEMAFSPSAEEALGLMAARPFDVVVSDMRMPGMNGAELLREVMSRHPATIRLVLSGHADRDIVAQCVGVAHQYIAKPCDPAQLKVLIRNAALIGGHLVEPEVKKVIGSLEHLPSVPQVYAELRSALLEEDTGPTLVGQILQKDPAMTAKVLKLVNSAFFGLPRTIASPRDAAAYLGLETLKMLVLSQGLFDQSRGLKTQDLSMEALWQHCLRVATGARAIARCEGMDAKAQDDCFVGGLLHDLGILILAGNFPKAYDEVIDLVRKEGVLLPTAEQEVFGCTHAEVGAYLLGLWGLPAPILRIISMHHRVFLENMPVLDAVLVVHAADVLCGPEGPPLFETGRFNREALARMGIEAHLERWRQAIAGPTVH